MENLQETLNNIFLESRNAIPDPEKFPWHKDSSGKIDSYKVQSSQALMLDVFGFLFNSKYKDEIINTVFHQDDRNWKIEFEYTDGSLLNEPRPSQIDVLLIGESTNLIIECKYTESDGGSCSQTKANKGLVQCNGNYEVQTNPTNYKSGKCSLSEKGIKYWKYISKTYNIDINSEFRPCPFKDGNYQWMRNVCFTKALQEKSKAKSIFYLCYFDSPNCSISKKVKLGYIEKINNNLTQGSKIGIITYQKIITTGIDISINSEESLKWNDLYKWVDLKEKHRKIAST